MEVIREGGNLRTFESRGCIPDAKRRSVGEKGLRLRHDSGKIMIRRALLWTL